MANDWEALKRAFRAEFRPQTNATQVMDELLKRRQGAKECISEYALSIEELCRKLDPHMKEEMKVAYFRNGLRDKIKMAMLTSVTPTLRNAIAVARQVETGLQGGSFEHATSAAPAAVANEMAAVEAQMRVLSRQLDEMKIASAGHGQRRYHDGRGQDNGNMRFNPSGERAAPPQHKVQYAAAGAYNAPPPAPIIMQRPSQDARAPSAAAANGNSARAAGLPSGNAGRYNLRDRPPPTCYKCNEVGHLAPNCPRRAQAPPQGMEREIIRQAADTLQQQQQQESADAPRPSQIPVYRRYGGRGGDNEQRPVNAVMNKPVVTSQALSTSKVPANLRVVRFVHDDKLASADVDAVSREPPARLLQTEGSICSVPVTMVVDTGSSYTFISEGLWAEVRKHLRSAPRRDHLKFVTATIDGQLEVLGVFDAVLKIGKVHIAPTMPVRFVRNLSCDMLLGNDFITYHALIVDIARLRLVMRRTSVAFKPDEYRRGTVAPLLPYRTVETEDEKQREDTMLSSVCALFQELQVDTVPAAISAAPAPLVSDEELDLDAMAIPQYAYNAEKYERPAEIARNVLIQQIHEQVDAIEVTSEITAGHLHDIRQLLVNNIDVFAVNPKSPGCVTSVEHIIDTGDAAPVKRKPYRYSPAQMKFLDEEIDALLKNNIIVPSMAAWASPLVLVGKKDGSTRTCVDFRHINVLTKKDSYPMPRADDMLSGFGKAQYFSTLDAASGYWQIYVAAKDQDKTTFVCHRGLYKFVVMPFGLCNAPATFQRLMDVTFAGMHDRCVKVYIDDILVYSDTIAQHLIDLCEVFIRLTTANIKLKMSKCFFFQPYVGFLGHIVSRDGVRPDPKKVEVIRNAPTPQDVPQLRSFLGLASYYRRFIAGFATVAAPLNALLKKDAAYVWSAECQLAFDTLKSKLTDDSLVRQPDFDRPFWLFTDASNVGIGAVLAQKDDDEKEYVISYASRSLQPAEKNYSVTEKECLAIIWATKEWRHYLIGALFHIVTDHSPLRWLMEVKDPSGRLARWALRLQEFRFTVEHRRGLMHSNADALSRAPIVPVDSQQTHNPALVAAVSTQPERLSAPAPQQQYTAIPADVITSSTSSASTTRSHQRSHRMTAQRWVPWQSTAL